MGVLLDQLMARGGVRLLRVCYESSNVAHDQTARAHRHHRANPTLRRSNGLGRDDLDLIFDPAHTLDTGSERLGVLFEAIRREAPVEAKHARVEIAGNPPQNAVTAGFQPALGGHPNAAVTLASFVRHLARGTGRGHRVEFPKSGPIENPYFSRGCSEPRLVGDRPSGAMGRVPRMLTAQKITPSMR
jgi:hypothetical protein